jgi:RNA polymerase sigma-70 factor (ECF subfamily)
MDGKPRRQDLIQAAVEEFERPLVGYVTHILGDVERARDVVQETFLRLCRSNRPMLKNHLAPWLYAVSRNLALDVRKKEARMKAAGEAPAGGALVDDSRPEEDLERIESVARVRAMVDALPISQKEAICLKFQHGLKYKEIALVMRTSVSNVGSLIHSGLNRIRKQLIPSRAGSGAGGVR